MPISSIRLRAGTPRSRRFLSWRYDAGVDPKSIVTVVGNLLHAAKGQQLRFVGDWVLHPKHSWQLKATAYEEVVPRSPQAVAAYLASTIDGELSPA